MASHPLGPGRLFHGPVSLQRAGQRIAGHSRPHRIPPGRLRPPQFGMGRALLGAAAEVPGVEAFFRFGSGYPTRIAVLRNYAFVRYANQRNMSAPENPFVFGEIVEEPYFVDRTEELAQLVRDLADGQKIFLLSPRRFGKSSLVALALLKLRKRHIRTVTITVSSYSSYTQFLEKFAEKVLRAAGPWERVKDWVTRFGRNVKPEISYDMNTGEVSLSLGRGTGFDPVPIAPEVFAMPGELARNAGFRMAICLDEFQQISEFDSGSVENAIRNQVQEH